MIQAISPTSPINTVTIREAAEALGVHRNTVYDWIKTGQLSAYRLGTRMVRLDADEVRQMLHPIPRP